MRIIRSKKEFYSLARVGLCGNTPRMWQCHTDYFNDLTAPDIVGVRFNKVGYPGIAKINYLNLHHLWRMGELDLHGEYNITEIPSRVGSSLQGELGWMKGRWTLYYCHELGYMRRQLSDYGKHAFGWQALRLLKYHCSASEYDELMDLFEYYTVEQNYPIIEFAVLKEPLGRLRRNTVIWEIRNGY